jgi:hypothetical protein
MFKVGDRVAVRWGGLGPSDYADPGTVVAVSPGSVEPYLVRLDGCKCGDDPCFSRIDAGLELPCSESELFPEEGSP